MFLLVGDGVPPDVEQAVEPDAAAHEKGAEVEAGAVLGEEEVDGVDVAITGGGKGYRIEPGLGRGVSDVEGVVDVDVAVDVAVEVVEDVGLEGVGRLHDVGVEVKPPEPGRSAESFKSFSEGGLPLSLRILPQRGANKVDLLPALTPLVGVALLRAHVDDLEVVAPARDVALLVAYRVALDGPLAGTLPLHDAAAHVGAQNDDKLGAATQPGRPAPPVYQGCVG